MTPETDIIAEAPLSVDEHEHLVLLEQQIEQGKSSVIDALAKIREGRLYREYGSFEQYVKERWGFTSRRANQLIAGESAMTTIQQALPEGTPVPDTEYALRPIASLPQNEMIETYSLALELSNGAAPTHDQIKQAKRELPDRRQQALNELEASVGVDHLVKEAHNGGDPVQLLALADLIASCEKPVQAAVIRANLHDRALIRGLNEIYRRNSETAQEILASGYLQFADGGAIKLADASAKHLRRLLDEKFREHQQAGRDQRGGEPVSVVVFNGSAERTFESIRWVLDRPTLNRLAELIWEGE